jgi:excisionase family DNA binding protein
MPGNKAFETLFDTDEYTRSVIDTSKQLISQQIDTLINFLCQCLLEGRITVASRPAEINSHERKEENVAVTDFASSDPQQLLTVGELAKRWKVSTRTIRRQIASGEITVVRIGRAVRIRVR